MGAIINGFLLRLCAAHLVVLSAPTVLRAQEPIQATPPDVRVQVVPFELRPAAPDDELLEVARAANVNLFVDATDVPEQASQVPTTWPGKQDWALEVLLTEITKGRRLAWQLQNEDRALLLSAEPNLKLLRQKMLQNPGIEVVTPQLDEAAFDARLLNYLRREQAWKAGAADWSCTIRIADLPEDLKHEVLARAQQGALSDPMSGVATMRELISDDAWKQTRLLIGSQKEMGGPDTVLLLSTKTPTGFVTRVLTPLPQPQAENHR